MVSETTLNTTAPVAPFNREDRIATELQSIPVTSPYSQRPPISSPYGTTKPSVAHSSDKPISSTNSSCSKKNDGEITCKDVVLVVALIVIVLVATVVTVTILIQKNSSKANPIFASKQIKYDFVVNSVAQTHAAIDFPTTIEDLNVAVLEEEAGAFLRAAKWIVDVDTVTDSEPSVLVRYALVTLYFAHEGKKWTRSNNWLSDKDTCEWEGVRCLSNSNESTNVQELDLSNNNLVGTLSPALSLLSDLKILWLDKNKITGPIHGEIFGSLPNLAILYLQENQLTGPIPKELRSNGLLYTLYIQNNQLTGTWPEEFCPECDDHEVCESPFTNFGVDCQAIFCSCCNPSQNCF